MRSFWASDLPLRRHLGMLPPKSDLSLRSGEEERALRLDMPNQLLCMIGS